MKYLSACIKEVKGTESYDKFVRSNYTITKWNYELILHLLSNNFPPMILITNKPMKLPGMLALASYRLSLYGFVSVLVQELLSLSLLVLL